MNLFLVLKLLREHFKQKLLARKWFAKTYLGCLCVFIVQELVLIHAHMDEASTKFGREISGISQGAELSHIRRVFVILITLQNLCVADMFWMTSWSYETL